MLIFLINKSKWEKNIQQIFARWWLAHKMYLLIYINILNNFMTARNQEFLDFWFIAAVQAEVQRHSVLRRFFSREILCKLCFDRIWLAYQSSFQNQELEHVARN